MPGIFSDLFTAAPNPSSGGASRNGEDPLVEVRKLAALVQKGQAMYQPIYGCESHFPESPRLSHLNDNAALVLAHFTPVKQKSQIRILDIGCNAGYVTFKIAEKIPNIVGLDLSAQHIALCQATAMATGSSARFLREDLLMLLERNEADLVNIDAVLLFNVVHQLIFAKGLSYVKTFLRRVASSVDVVFVELATRAEYVRMQLDQSLPNEPEEVFEDCVDCHIERVRSQPRPTYRLTRTRNAFMTGVVEVLFSNNPDPGVSRKYYRSLSRFTKQYRITPLQKTTFAKREINALLRLKDRCVVPQIIDWFGDESSYAITTERVYGEAVFDIVMAKPPLARCERIVNEVLRIAATLHEVGIYQNDMSAHNFIELSDGTLRLLDFEQATDIPVTDHFAFLLWLIHDLRIGDRLSYRRRVYDKLRVTKGASRAPKEHYPNLGSLPGEPFNREFVAEAENTSADWGTFVKKWVGRLGVIAPL